MPGASTSTAPPARAHAVARARLRERCPNPASASGRNSTGGRSHHSGLYPEWPLIHAVSTKHSSSCSDESRCGLAGGAVAASVAWSLTIPLMASPDEPAQTFAVSAAADGQFRTPFVEIPDLGRQSVVNVPRRLAQYDRYADCMMIDPTRDASCQYLQPLAETPEVEVRTQFGRYPPTYYLLVGLPSRAIDGTTSPRTMRTVSALLVGAVFGLGLWLLARYHRSAYAVPAAAVALTPAVLALGGTVNASSFEVATAFAAWCGVACLASRDDLPRPLCWWTTVSLSLLIVSRPVSPLWAAIILVVLMVHRGRDLVRERSVRWCLAPLAVAGAGWVAWTVAMGTPPLLGQPPDRTGLRPALGIIRRAPSRTPHQPHGQFPRNASSDLGADRVRRRVARLRAHRPACEPSRTRHRRLCHPCVCGRQHVARVGALPRTSGRGGRRDTPCRCSSGCPSWWSRG
ncbi:MAG: DUF2142 domain-containing protein [Microthrixaceae bacterium]